MSEPIPIPQSKLSISYWLRSSDKIPSPTMVEKAPDSEIFEMDDDEQVSALKSYRGWAWGDFRAVCD